MNWLTQVNKSITIKMLLATFLIIPTLAPQAKAQGIAAGTTITNTAYVSYNMGNTQGPKETIEATNTFIVAETINATLTSSDSGQIIVPTPATNKTLTWVLTNTGNGSESYSLTSNHSLVNDDFDPQVQTIWLESNGVPGLQNTDSLYQAANSIPLTSDQSQTIYIQSSIPANLSVSQLGNVALIATSTTPGITNSTVGSSIPGAGDGGTDAVVLIEHGRIDSIGTYSISTVKLLLQKTVENIIDPYSGTEVMSQSLITYKINVNATGSANGVIENLIIEDTTPANMQFVAGSIKLNGNSLTDTIDTDAADFNFTKHNTVTFKLGDITPPSNQIITITYKVD